MTKTIWVDADACPNVIKDILFRAAQRRQVQVTLVANAAISAPPGPTIRAVQVAKGFDVADDYIAQHVEANQLVITSDIPLADQAITRGAQVLTPRGEALTPDNIKPRLTMRNFLDEMRGSGERTGGPKALGQQDKQAFANALDRWLAK